MTTIAEVRQKYPQYSDMSDEQLARGLHGKYYSDMPFDAFVQKIGLTAASNKSNDYPGKGGFVDSVKNVRDAVAESPALRQLAIGSRDVGEAAASVPSLVTDVVRAPINLALGAAGSDTRIPGLNEALTNLGVPVPETEGEQLASSIRRGVVGALSGAGTAEQITKGATGVTKGVAEVMAARPGLQAVSGGTGAAAATLEGQHRVISDQLQKIGIPAEWADKTGEFLAGFAGSVVPSAVEAGLPAVTRRAFRGGEAGRQVVEQNIDDFAKAGTTPTVGQATGGRMAQGAESLAGRTPGGAGRMVKAATEQADDIQAAVNSQADDLARVTGADEAGRAIERGVRGTGGFIETFKAKQQALYNELDNHIPGQAPVDVSKTKKALESLNADIPGAPALSQWFKNARIKGIKSAMDDDLATALKNGVPDSLPYEAIKKLRTLVGNELADSGIASDVPRSKWKALYAALSDDLEGVARQQGPDATQAWSRANSYTRAGMKRLEVIESAIDRAGGYEAIFKASTSGTKEGATVLRSTMQSLPEDARKIVSATVLKRLGVAKAGVQNDVGDKFSTETFLTNWNNLSTAAKRTLFDRYGAEFRNNLDTVAKVTSNIREGSKVFRNPSGTEQATAQAGLTGGALVALITGQWGALGAIGATVGGANMTARLMTNPNFVKWLAGTTKMPQAAYGAQVGVLAAMAEREKDPDLAEAARLLAENGKKPEQKNQDRKQQHE